MRLLVNICLATACCLSLAAAYADDRAGDSNNSDNPGAGAPAPVDTSFLDTARGAWSRLRAECGRGYAAKCHAEAPKSNRVYESELFYHRVYQLSRTEVNTPERYIMGLNRRYSFYLGDDEKNGEYTTASFKIRKTLKEEQFAETTSAAVLLLGGLIVENDPIERLVQDPSVQFTKAADLTDQDSGQKIKEVEFRSDYIVLNQEKSRITRGRIQFLPDLYWQIKEYTVWYDSTDDPSERFVSNSAITYQTVDGLPLPDTLEVRFSFADDPDNPLGMVRSRLYEIHRQAPVKKQCFLKYYGQKEPPLFGVDEYIQYAMFLLAFVLIGLGIFLRHRRPRTASASGEPS